MQKEHVDTCIFSKWYNDFKNVTLESEIVPLPKEFVQYLLEDGFVMPKGCKEKQSRVGLQGDSDDEVDWGDDDSDDDVMAPEFPTLIPQIEQSISRLGGQVFPKLNWSAPRDATWISFDATLKCKSPGDVIMLIKSSDFVTHDLTRPYECCEDDIGDNTKDIEYQLVLRRWVDINRGHEFRCFVKCKTLLGISQRYHQNYFDFIAPQKDNIIENITTFFTQTIKDKFPNDNYVFDIFISKQNEVTLVDFNPFGPVTDSLLFEWEELLSPDIIEKNNLPIFRYIEDEKGIKPSKYEAYAIPQDFVHLSTGEDPAKMLDLLRLKIQDEQSSDEDVADTSAAPT